MPLISKVAVGVIVFIPTLALTPSNAKISEIPDVEDAPNKSVVLYSEFVFGFIYHKFKEKRKMKRKEYSHNTYLKLKKIKKCCKWGSRLNLQIHHKKLLSNGGTNKFSNLEKICEYCHKKIHKSNT